MWSYLQTFQRPEVLRREPKKKDKAIPSGNYHIVVVLDESLSMRPERHNIIASLNNFIDKQKRIIGGRPTKFTLVKFSDAVERTLERRSLDSIRPLGYEDYIPDGNTALYDAIGDTIDWFIHESEVLMVIVTDGAENRSRRYTKASVSQMIERQKQRGWTYVYLSNDLSTQMQGDDIALHTDAQCTNACVPQRAFGSYIANSLNDAVAGYRTRGVSVQSQLC